MFNEEKFLRKAQYAESVISESKLLDSFSTCDKAVVICVEESSTLIHSLNDLLDKILHLPKSDISQIHFKDSEIFSKKIGNRPCTEAEFMNRVLEISRNENCIVYAVNDGMKFIAVNGELNKEVDICLSRTATMQEKLKSLKPISDLVEVFEYFIIDCQYHEEYYNECFNETGKIKGEIKEQELRNILLDYLKGRIKGEVSPEYCTSYTKDEESVDIYLNDGQERAIIEVKFSFKRSTYDGKSFYNLQEKCQLGIEQLNRYVIHLKQDNRLVDYGFVYMFFHNENNDEELNKTSANLKKYLKTADLSAEFYSIFKKVIYNDMSQWGKKIVS